MISSVAAESRAPTVTVVGTEFRIARPDGTVLMRQEVVGSVLTTAGAAGKETVLRIDAALPDPLDRDGDVYLYKLAVRDAVTGVWKNMCSPDPDGFALGFPVSGTWTERGEHKLDSNAFTLTCTTGGIGKCVRMGYKPWKTGPNGTPLENYHQACTRMLRADYCGDGTPHTRDGVRVDVYDNLNIRSPVDNASLSFEAAWAPDGAVCVRKPRLPDSFSLDQLVERCPQRLAGKVGDACSPEAVRKLPEAVILNSS